MAVTTFAPPAGMEMIYQRPESLADVHTHYCPGCMHGVAHRLLAEALDELGLRERTILVAPVGCSVFAYNYFAVDAVEAAHGRAPAMATGIKRVHPDNIVITYQGDGDLAAIGTAEIVHAAARGENITGLRPFEINRRGLSRSFQVTNIFPRLSVWENVRCAVLWSKGYKYSFWQNVDKLEDVRARTQEILEQINMANRAEIPAGVLTYAEQRALEIGITIAGGADIILLDEPTAGMSRSETEHAVALIKKVSEGRTLIIIEHDMGVVFNLADRISVLVYGQIIATDEPAKIKANQKVQEAYLGAAGHD